MKRIELSAYGPAEKVAQCVDVADVGSPDPGEVVFEVLAFPINPADLLFCEGAFRGRAPLPAVPGAECVGRVIGIGAGVTDFAIGDKVLNLKRENWSQRRRVRADDLVKLPANIDSRQAAMLRINPPTAWMLLATQVALHPGDWIIQNAANSAVGRLIVALAKQREVRTINLVRRPEAMSDILSLGGDLCFIDETDITSEVFAATGGAGIRLGLDAVGGAAPLHLAKLVGDGGTVCVYGTMSAEESRVSSNDLIFRDLTFKGFQLGRALAKVPLEELRRLYGRLAELVTQGKLVTPIERVYSIDEIGTALSHSRRSRPGGKIMVAPNGTI